MVVDNIITNADVYNFINVDLAGRLNCKGQANETIVVSNFIAKAQRQIINLIATYAYGGLKAVNDLFANELTAITTATTLTTLQQAVLMQVEYNLNNLSISRIGGIVAGSAGASERFTIDERIQASWSPEAFQLLRNAGFLYSGIGGGHW